MGKRRSGAIRSACVELVEARILLSAVHSPGSHNTPHIPKPTAAQIAAALKETVVEPIALPTRNGVQDNATFPTAPATGGYSASQLLKTYGIDQVQNDGGTGAGQTIAIIDALDDPDATTDMATFDAAMGLPAPPNFWIVGQNGGAVPAPSGSSGDSVETSLDIEWAHSVAPQANILLVEADSLTDEDLIQNAVNWAETQTTYPNVSTISMSFGGPDSAGEESLNNYFTTPAGHTGITFIASTGDDGAYGDGGSTAEINYPAASPNVLAIGGTTALSDAASNNISEIGWGFGTAPNFEGSGGGISATEPQPTYQNGIVAQTSSWRTVPDVSFDADPDTGVAICDSYDNGSTDPWEEIGGTSLSAPVWAGLISIVDQQRVNNGLGTLDGPTQTLPMIYALSSSDFNDITGGNNGAYNALAGYDLVTGRGTPIVDKLVNDLAGQTAAADLTFSTPTGWQSPLVVTPTIGARTDAPFIAGTTLFVNWNGVNAGLVATNTPFHSELLVDGVVKQTLTTSSSVAAGGTFSTTDFSIGSLSAGTHTISVDVNYLNEQTETNTANNVYTRKITVSATNLSDIRPYTPPGWSAPIVASNVSGGTTDTTLHTTDTVYLNIAFANFGSSTTGSFFVAVSLNGQIVGLVDDIVLTSNRVEELSGNFGSFPAGTYSITLVNNYNQSSTETNYTNDDYLTSFTVLPSIGNISGTVFQDDNSDGTLDGADVGLSGQTVYLDVNNDGIFDSGDISTTTTTGGAYTFSNVNSGTYTVREVVPAGYVESSPAGNSYSVTLSAGQNLTGENFGNFPIVYSDNSGNDSYTVQLDPTATTLQILVGGTPIYSAPASIVPSLSFSPGVGSDTLTVNGANGNPVPSGGITFDDGSNVSSDTLNILGSSGPDSFTANAGQVLFGSNAINYTNVQTLIIDPGAGSDTLAVNSGTVNLPAQTTGSGILVRTFASLTVANGATLVVGTNASSHPDRTLIVASNLSVDSASSLNLGGNDMIVHNNGNLAAITALLSTGYSSGNWNGVGIDSSAAAADSSKLTALGVLLNNANGSTYYSTFDGQPATTTDVLIKFTYYGDANLDGAVNGSDYSLIDNGFNAQLADWQNGDFNYDNSINGADYFLLDNSFNNPQPPL